MNANYRLCRCAAIFLGFCGLFLAAANDSLPPPTTAALKHGPWIVPADLGTATIRFVTDKVCPAGVEYRALGALQWKTAWDQRCGLVRNDRNYHTITLTGLEQGRTYEYRPFYCSQVWFRLENGQARWKLTPHFLGTWTFTAFSESLTEYEFSIIGDTQFTPEMRTDLLGKFWHTLRMPDASFIVHLGDADSVMDDFDSKVLGGCVDILGRKDKHTRPFFLVRGNHEYWYDEANHFFRYFDDGNERSYYTFQQGGAFFIVLDAGSDRDYINIDPLTLVLDDGSQFIQQRRWLEDVVESEAFKKADFRVVLIHTGPHTGSEAFMRQSVYTIMDGILIGKNPRTNIHLMFAGHNHHYLRTRPNSDKVLALEPPKGFSGKDVPFPVVTCDGPAGGGVHTSGFHIKVTADKMEVKACEANGTVLDHFTVDTDGNIAELSRDPRIREFDFVSK